MDLGVVVGGDLRALARLASQAEERGFESVWVAETARSAFVQAAVACQATSRVRVGTDIALAFPRSPTITAMAARDLAELSGGRFALGLGSQVKRVNEQRFGIPFEHPAPRMEEAVGAIREVLATFDGRPIDHRGRFYSITMPPFPGAGPAPGGGVPIYLAAVNERMAEAAGRVADGVLGHPIPAVRARGAQARRGAGSGMGRATGVGGQRVDRSDPADLGGPRAGAARGRPADRLLRHHPDLPAGPGAARPGRPSGAPPAGVRPAGSRPDDRGVVADGGCARRGGNPGRVPGAHRGVRGSGGPGDPGWRLGRSLRGTAEREPPSDHRDVRPGGGLGIVRGAPETAACPG